MKPTDPNGAHFMLSCLVYLVMECADLHVLASDDLNSTSWKEEPNVNTTKPTSPLTGSKDGSTKKPQPDQVAAPSQTTKATLLKRSTSASTNATTAAASKRGLFRLPTNESVISPGLDKMADSCSSRVIKQDCLVPVLPLQTVRLKVTQDISPGTWLPSWQTGMDFSCNVYVTKKYVIHMHVSAESYFTIDELTGQLQAFRALMDLNTHVLVVNVRCREDANITVLIIIDVEPVNKFPPLFMRSDYFFILHRNISFSNFVGQVTAVDNDLGKNGQIGSYQIYGGNEDKHFSIDSNGVITTAKLIFPEERSYFLEVEAMDKGLSFKKGRTTVTVMIVDTACALPSFTKDFYFYQLTSNSVPDGLELGYMSYDKKGYNAIDIDITEDRIKKYFTFGEIFPEKALLETSKAFSFADLTSHLAPFQVTANIFLFTAKICPLTTDRCGKASIFLSLEQIAMLPDQILSVNLSENNAANLTVVDVSHNIGKANSIYMFVGTYLDFTIHPTLGVISTMRSFDRETGDKQFVLVVEALSRETICSNTEDQITVVVNILDENDNSPSFSFVNGGTLNGSVFENSLSGTEVLLETPTHLLEVYDVDQAENGSVTLSLNGATQFRLKRVANTSYAVYVKTNWSLDREWRSHYNVSIVARDGGTPACSSVIYLLINVKDVNDHSPQFQFPSYNLSTAENSPIGTIVGFLHAGDKDSGLNGLVEYSIVNGANGFFQIGKKNGSVYLVIDKLDREIKDVFHITIRAQDQGYPRKQTFTSLNIYIDDINDNSPEFSQQMYNVTIPENSLLNMLIFQAEARDKDLGAAGDVSFFVNPTSSYFYIDKRNGSLFLNSSLDFESSLKEFSLNILACDDGSPKKCSAVPAKILVANINDEVPAFPQSLYVGWIGQSASSAASKVITVVQAIDQDSKIQYSLWPSSSEFTIDQSGLIIQIRQISTTQFSPGALYKTFTVIASDSMYETNVSLKIYCTHTSKPVKFSKALYKIEIPEDLQPGSQVLKLKLNQMGTHQTDVTFHFLFPLIGFKLEASTGVMYSNGFFDREYTSNLTREFTVVAKDLNQNILAAAAVAVKITDVNDNAPKCSRLLYRFSQVEDSFIGSRVGKIQATDRDLGRNAEFTFRFKAGNLDETFNIKNTGEIVLAEVLDREKLSSYNLTVLVEDKGEKPLNSTCTVLVSVEDINDNDPVFEKQQYTASVNEEAPPYQLVLHVRCLDPDESSKIRYRLLTIDSVFSLNPETGVLETNAVIDHEKSPSSYQLYAECTDGGDFPRYSTPVILNVTVTDINDNPPVFTESVYETTLYTNKSEGSHIVTVSATDKDSGDNSRLSYHIIGGDPDNEFFLHPQSGVLVLKVSQLHKPARSRTLFVEVYDHGYPQAFSAFTKVNIDIVQLNQHSPEFASDVIYTRVKEELIKPKIIQLKATDKDPDDFLTYEMAPYSGSGLKWTDYFSVLPNGWINLEKKIDRDALSVSYAHFVVLAIDSGFPCRTGMVTVKVNMTDINDNPPRFETKDIHVIEIPQGFHIPQRWFLPKAEDGDEGPNAEIGYKIQVVPTEEDSKDVFYGSFGVSSDQREVFALKRLPEKLRKARNFTLALVGISSTHSRTTLSYKAQNVLPLEQAGSQTKAEAEIFIRIKMVYNDTNIYEPSFIGITSLFSLSVPGNTSTGAKIYQFTATDEDKNDNNITYTVHTNETRIEHLFTIGMYSGILYLHNPIRDVAGNFTLWVTASDNDLIPKSKMLLVKIEITEYEEIVMGILPPTKTGKTGWPSITIPLPILAGAIAGIILVMFLFMGLLICQCKKKKQKPRQMRPEEEDQYHEAIHDKHSLPHSRRPDLVRPAHHDGHENQQLLSPNIRSNVRDNAYTHWKKSGASRREPTGGVSLPGLSLGVQERPHLYTFESTSNTPSSNTPSRNTLDTDYAIPEIPEPDYEDFPPPPPLDDPAYMMASTPHKELFRSKI